MLLPSHCRTAQHSSNPSSARAQAPQTETSDHHPQTDVNSMGLIFRALLPRPTPQSAQTQHRPRATVKRTSCHITKSNNKGLTLGALLPRRVPWPPASSSTPTFPFAMSCSPSCRHSARCCSSADYRTDNSRDSSRRNKHTAVLSVCLSCSPSCRHSARSCASADCQASTHSGSSRRKSIRHLQ